MAYFYAKNIDRTNDKFSKSVVSVGNSLNSKYSKTKTLILMVSKEIGVLPILFKTFKHVPEIVDNDIDLVLKRKDVVKFVMKLEKLGFLYIKESKYKYICTKKGYNKIEPRADILVAGRKILNYQQTLKYVQKIGKGNEKITVTNQELDAFYFMLNCLYGPNYLKLYHYMVIDGVVFSRIEEIAKDISCLPEITFFKRKVLDKISKDVSFPIFLKNIDYLVFYIRFIMFNSNMIFTSKIKHLLFFFFFKYKYIFFNKLHFQHQWPIRF